MATISKKFSPVCGSTHRRKKQPIFTFSHLFISSLFILLAIFIFIEMTRIYVEGVQDCDQVLREVFLGFFHDLERDCLDDA